MIVKLQSNYMPIPCQTLQFPKLFLKLATLLYTTGELDSYTKIENTPQSSRN